MQRKQLFTKKNHMTTYGKLGRVSEVMDLSVGDNQSFSILTISDNILLSEFTPNSLISVVVLTSNTEILKTVYVVGSQPCLYRTTSHLGAHKTNAGAEVPPQTQSGTLADRIHTSVL